VTWGVKLKTLEIKVKPGTKTNSIKENENGSLVITMKQKPVDNKANLELKKMLKKKYNWDVEILKGLKSKNKIIKVR